MLISVTSRFWAMKFHDYPLYTFALMLGQILSMNSLQLGILVGTVSQDEGTLYTVGTIYTVSSVLWWGLHQRLQTVHVICLPFLLFGCSFLLLAAIILCKPTLPVSEGRLWQLVQVLYVGGSSSGSLYFAMNFLEDESSPIESWIQRAAYIYQGFSMDIKHCFGIQPAESCEQSRPEARHLLQDTIYCIGSVPSSSSSGSVLYLSTPRSGPDYRLPTVAYQVTYQSSTVPFSVDQSRCIT